MRRPVLHACFLAAILALPARAEIGSFSAQLPEASTWREDLTAQWALEANCYVQTGEVSLQAGSLVIVQLQEQCTIDPPVFQPFSGQADLPLLSPGHYTVRFMAGNVTLFNGSLTVYETADLEIDLPEESVNDDTPLTFSVTGITSTCLEPEAPALDGQAIAAEFPLDCPILPPGGGPMTFDYTIGPLPAGTYEIRVFVGELGLAKRPVRIYDAARCVPSPTTLCLHGDRFRVEAAWKDFTGGAGQAQAVPLEGRDDTGLMWFFWPGNIELTVKVLNGCGLNDRYWVFVASGSTVEYSITVTDTTKGTAWTTDHAAGSVPALIADTDALATCP